jgi:hypothetical protein
MIWILTELGTLLEKISKFQPNGEAAGLMKDVQKHRTREYKPK